jgi:tRNA-modifying protein YgfZ
VTAPTAAEVVALRTGAGAFLNRRDVLALRGDDAEAYLSQDITTLAIGGTTDALLLEPDGKLCALLRISRLDGLGYALDVDAGFGDRVEARLRKFLLRSKVQITRLDWRCLSLRGSAVDPAAAGLLTVLTEAGVMVLPFEWNGWTGVDLLGTPDLVLDPTSGGLPDGITSCGPEAVEACRIVSGIPVMGSELTEKTIAAEADLLERAVSFTKGCYTGQELVARLDARGNKVARRLVGVVGGTDPSGPALSYGMTLHAGAEPPAGDDGDDGATAAVADKVVGTITSAAWSPEMGGWAALAYLHRSVESPGAIRVRSGDGLGGSHPARVAALPLLP